MVACALLLGVHAASATATITNVQPFNGQSDPISGDEVFDNEEIWAYVTSPTGGVVCIERYSQDPGSCKSDFAYAETPVLPFFAGFVPITPGNLLPGPMMLVAAEGPGEPVTAVSQAFYVRPCKSGCPVVNFGPSQEFKAASSALLDSVKDVCNKVQAASLLWRSKQLYQDTQEIVAGYSGGLAAGAIISIGVQAGTATYDFVKGDDLTTKLPGNLSTVADMTCKAAELVDKIKENTWVQYGARWAADPPDPGYTQVARPQFVDFDSILGYPSFGFDAERDALDGLRAYAEAGLHGWERYQGALPDATAQGLDSQHMQARATSDYLLGYANRLRSGSVIVKALASRIRSEIPDGAQRTITQADINAANVYVDRLRTSGFNATETANLHALGLSDGAIARFLVDQKLWDPSDAQPGLLDADLDTLGDAMLTLADQAEAFARAGGVVAGRNARPLTASFAGLLDGSDQLDVEFVDQSLNPGQDPLTIDWDFGDGTAGAGPTVRHHYAARGTYTVTESLSNDYETVTSTQQQGAGPQDQRPVASFTATPASGNAPLQVHLDASASHDPDGSIVDYEWAFDDGSAPATGKTLDHEFTLPSPQGYSVQLTVVDDLSANDVATRKIVVTPPPTAPTAGPDLMTADPEGFVDVLANDADANVEPVSVKSTGAAGHGTVSCAANGACHYVADAGYSGDDQFDYVIADPGGLEATATVHVTVTAPPQGTEPVPADDAAATRAGQQVAVDVLANDSGTPALAFVSAGAAKHGTVDCTGAGVCSYTPDAGFTGRDGFTYTMTDATATNRTAEVHVTVVPAGAKYALTVAGGPDPLESGKSANWAVAVRGATPDAPELTTQLSGAHALDAGSVSTAKGWTATATGAKAGAGALLGDSISVPLVKPMATVSQGTGGDGHVPILVGDRVYAFFHHQFPTAVSCIDRSTNRRCPGYPVPIGLGTDDVPGAGVVIGTHIYLQVRTASFYQQTAAVGVYCWDTATTRPCGFVIVDRVLSTQTPVTSPLVQVAGKLYFAADTGRLYCVDPGTMATCDSLATGLIGPSLSFDALAHGSRVFISGAGAGLTCIDVSTGLTCAGWTLPVDTGGYVNIINRHAPDGSVNGICLVKVVKFQCFADATPGTARVYTDVPINESYWSTAEEAEAGTRTLFGAHGHAGLTCFDWVTLAPCRGGGYQNGELGKDVNGDDLPEAYGAAFDGACAVGLGDPGLVFTVDPKGFAPCSGLAGEHSIDLRDQRCGATVGAASWDSARLEDAGQGELAAVRVTVRDAASGQVLASKNIVNGVLDLSGIDAQAHPAITLGLAVVALPGSTAWDDAIPPRIMVSWHADPAQLCFRTATQAACAVAPVGVTAALPDATAKKSIALTPVGCPTATPPTPTPTPTTTTTVTPAPTPPPSGATEAVLACGDRRVVLEDVFMAGGKVHLLGVADRALAGQTVQLVFAPTGKVVATATLQADGHFETLAPLPPKALRTSSKARYRARISGLVSLNLKLVRRMLVTSITSAGGKVTIRGLVIGPLATRRADRAISVQRVVGCKRVETLERIQPSARGAFSVTLAAPSGQAAAVYRLATKVRRTATSKGLIGTFTLPRAVDFT